MCDVQIVQQRIELGLNLLFPELAQFQNGTDILRNGQLAKDVWVSARSSRNRSPPSSATRPTIM